jgi:hypothetical protein
MELRWTEKASCRKSTSSRAKTPIATQALRLI